MEKKNRKPSALNHNPITVVAEREGARVGATGTGTRIPPGIEARICLNHDVIHAEPDGMDLLAHVTYSFISRGGRLLDRAVDYFGLPGSLTHVSPTAYPVDPVLESKTGVMYTIPQKFVAKMDIIRGLVAAHIRDHLGDRFQPAVLPDLLTGGALLRDVKPPAPRVVGRARLEKATKKMLKVTCRYVLHIDLSCGCIAATDARGFATPRSGCTYCYHHLLDKYGAHSILAFDAATESRRLRRLTKGIQGPIVLCIGVNADPGHLIYRAELLKVLRFCLAEGLVPVVRSKFLEHDLIVADLLIQTGGVFVVSLGNDDLEPGVVAHGRTQAARIADALHYMRDGVNVVAGILCDPAQENGGPWFEGAIKIATATLPQIILYAQRAKSDAEARKYFGADFKAKKTPTGTPMYERHGSEWVAAYVHPTIAQLIGTNRGAVRLCLKSAAGEHCGKCFVPGEVGTVTGAAPATVLAPLAKAEIPPVAPIISANDCGSGRAS